MITERHTNLILLFFSSAVLIVMLLVTVCSDNLIGLDGKVGIIDHQPLWNSCNPLIGAFYTFGDWGCHQETARSIVIGTSQMPLCIRETAILIGVILGCTILHLFPTLCNRTVKMIVISIFLGLATLLEWLVQELISFYVMAFVAISGILTGIGGAILLYCIIWIETVYLSKQDFHKN